VKETVVHVLLSLQEIDAECELYAVAVKKEGIIIGDLPRKVS